MNGWMNKWTDGWINEWMDERMDEWMKTEIWMNCWKIIHSYFSFHPFIPPPSIHSFTHPFIYSFLCTVSLSASCSVVKSAHFIFIDQTKSQSVNSPSKQSFKWMLSWLFYMIHIHTCQCLTLHLWQVHTCQLITYQFCFLFSVLSDDGWHYFQQLCVSTMVCPVGTISNKIL